jgi:retinol dehydrogenase 12
VSEIGREAIASSIFYRVAISVLYFIFARTSEQGARQVVYAALANGDELKGGYVNRQGVEEPSDFVVDEKGKTIAKRQWVSVQLISAFEPSPHRQC